MLSSGVPVGDGTPGGACQDQELVRKRLIIHLVRFKQLDLGPIHAFSIQFASPPLQLASPKLSQHAYKLNASVR